MKYDELEVRQFETRQEMGAVAAADIRDRILQLLQEKETINMIFAAAPSQNEVLQDLAEDPRIPWERINAFHMDEYIGLSTDAPQCFGNFLRRHLFDLVNFRSVHCIDSAATPEEAAEKYTRLLETYPVDIVVMGIGENGHIPFNDPGFADFNDPHKVKTVKLDPVCRQQQVNDGCFASLEEVPQYALTLTVPALMAAPWKFCIVPAKSKAWAVQQTLCGPVSAQIPASVLRLQPGAVLYLDRESGSLL